MSERSRTDEAEVVATADAFAPERLDGRILEWEHRTDALDRELVEARRRLEATREAVATLIGIGEGPRGAVRAAVGAHNHLLDLVIEPAALRLGSIDALTREVMAAVQNAQNDVARKLATAVGPEPDPVPASDRLPELDDMLTPTDEGRRGQWGV